MNNGKKLPLKHHSKRVRPHRTRHQLFRPPNWCRILDCCQHFYHDSDQHKCKYPEWIGAIFLWPIRWLDSLEPATPSMHRPHLGFVWSCPVCRIEANAILSGRDIWTSLHHHPTAVSHVVSLSTQVHRRRQGIWSDSEGRNILCDRPTGNLCCWSHHGVSHSPAIYKTDPTPATHPSNNLGNEWLN